MEQSYYQAYFRLERENWWFKVRAKIILSRIRLLLRTAPNPKILNVGVATGHLSELMAPFGTVQSVEYDDECFRFLKKNVPIDVVQGSILDLPFADDYYDLVCAFDVVEHVEDDQLAVQELQRVAKPGGRVMVTVPAFMFLWSEHDAINHHVRRYTLRKLRALFASSGKISYATYFNAFLFLPITLFRVLSRFLPSRSHPQSDFALANGKVTNRLLYTVFNAEHWLIKRGITFPIGVSLALVWRKPPKPSYE